MLTLERNWWAFVLRGIAALVFGVLTFVKPAQSLLALVITFGIYAMADGLFGLVSAVNASRRGQRWGTLVAGGLLSLGAGITAVAWPGISWMALLSVMAVWAVVRGGLEIGAAISLRKRIKNEWLLALDGVLAIAFGVLVFARPVAGSLAVIWTIGVFAVASGLALLGLGFRLRARGHGAPIDFGRHAPA